MAMNVALKTIGSAAIVAIFSFVPLGAPQAAEWKAGAAKLKITPREHLWMAGYGSRDKPNEGTLSDLWAKALVLEDGQGHRAVIVSLDLVGIARDLSQAVCAELASKYGLERSQILIACSHTHSGPVVGHNLRPTHYELRDDHQRQLIDQYAVELQRNIVAVVGEAIRSMKASQVFWGDGTAGFAVNRRENKEPDVPKLIAEGKLKGPVDHDVPVLAAKDADGRLTALVVGYACHATVLNGYDWSADWPGYAQTELEKAHPGCTALFVAGCGADQNPLPRRTVELAQKYGRELATAVDTVLGKAMTPLSGKIETAYREVDLPFSQLPTQKQLESDLNDKHDYVVARARMLLKQLNAIGKLAETYPYPVEVWRLGPLTLVALGGEVVVDYSLRLKLDLHLDKLWVASYSNDVMAYIPSRRVLAEGGYEGGTAMVYYGLPCPWGPEIEERIVRTVRALLPATTAKQ
jgi:hypothetical protein